LKLILRRFGEYKSYEKRYNILRQYEIFECKLVSCLLRVGEASRFRNEAFEKRDMRFEQVTTCLESKSA
jgi:hypothetical protein